MKRPYATLCQATYVGGHLWGNCLNLSPTRLLQQRNLASANLAIKTCGLFPIHADLDNDEWSYSSDECEALCAGCIRRLPLRRFAWRDSERRISQIVNEHHPKGTLNGAQRQSKLVSICDEYRRSPEFPLFLQNEDWPYCCGNFCEYLGVPESYEQSIQIGREMQCWEGDFTELYGDMTLEPESLNEVCLFRCLTCDARMFTWQCT